MCSQLHNDCCMQIFNQDRKDAGFRPQERPILVYISMEDKIKLVCTRTITKQKTGCYGNYRNVIPPLFLNSFCIIPPLKLCASSPEVTNIEH